MNRLLNREFRNRPQSKHSIFDNFKVISRFTTEEYQEKETKKKLLRSDLLHFAKEVALVEPVTKFSYYYDFEKKQTLGDGYSEGMEVLLSNFGKDLSEKGFSANRATVEAVAFSRIQKYLVDIVQNKRDMSIILTSPPDSVENGYHGADSLFNWHKPERNHTFYFHIKPQNITEKGFEIHTTQYRLWPNMAQNIQIQEKFGAKIPDETLNSIRKQDITNVLLSNLILIDHQSFIDYTKHHDIDSIIKEMLFFESDKHFRNYKTSPMLDLENFWSFENDYFENFYLDTVLPIFEKIEYLDIEDQNNFKEIQETIDQLDDAFSLYSGIISAYIKQNNTNPLFKDAFLEHQLLKILQKKFFDTASYLLVKLDFIKQQDIDKIPSVDELKEKHQLLYKAKSGQTLDKNERKKILELWGFLNMAHISSSLLQCGLIAPFTMPISLLKQPFAFDNILKFQISMSLINVVDQKLLLEEFKNDNYVELDLTEQGAKSVYVVPQNYLEGKGCIVGDNGEVLGPCVDPETGKRISFDDPRETKAYPMTLTQFREMLNVIEEKINKKTLENVEEKINKDINIDAKDKKKAKNIFVKLKKMLIKPVLGLQEFITGEFVETKNTKNEWINELITELKNSSNPIKLLFLRIEEKMDKDPNFFEEENKV